VAYLREQCLSLAGGGGGGGGGGGRVGISCCCVVQRQRHIAYAYCDSLTAAIFLMLPSLIYRRRFSRYHAVKPVAILAHDVRAHSMLKGALVHFVFAVCYTGRATVLPVLHSNILMRAGTYRGHCYVTSLTGTTAALTL